MSTSSQIAKLMPDGKVKSVYCHSDSYPEHNGKYLLENYNTAEKVNALLALGGLSYLQENLNPLPQAPPLHNWDIKNIGGKIETKDRNHILLTKHSFDDPQKGVTIAYHRDRGEELLIGEYNSLEELLKDEEHWASYFYLWKENKWFVASNDKEKSEFFELTQEMVEKNRLPNDEDWNDPE